MYNKCRQDYADGETLEAHFRIHEENRVDSIEMFKHSKINDIHSVKIIGEYFANYSKELVATKNTFALLDAKLGMSFYRGNFKDRKRYESILDIV